LTDEYSAFPVNEGICDLIGSYL